MTAKKTGLDDELERLYRRPPGEFIAARNELAKQVGQNAGAADKVRASPKPTPSAWAVNALFEHEAERMDALLAAGERARAGQKEAVSGRGAEGLRASLEAARKLVEEMRRRGAALLTAAGVALSKATSDRLATNLQALAFSPAAAAEATRRWLDRDLDPPGFEVLAGLQLAGAPVVDFAARKAQREAKKEEKPERKLHAVPNPAPAKSARAEEERERREAVERAQAEREAERRRRRIEVAEEKLARARNEAAAAKEEAAQADKAAAEARRRAEAAEAAAGRAEEKAGRAAERVERAEDELKGAKEGN
jgi:hypothetical protein